MKTLTEFSGFALREAIAKSKEIQAALGTEGKSAEELASALQETLGAFLTEKFKLEGERRDLFAKAVEVAGAKAKELENLKRVVVYLIAEGEKLASSIKADGAHGFLAEYLAPLRSKQGDRRKEGSKHAGGKGGPKDGKGKKGRGRRRPDLKGKRPDGGPERRGANAPKPASP